METQSAAGLFGPPQTYLINYLFQLALTYTHRLEIDLKLYFTVFELMFLLKNKSLLEYLKKR
jgi:hypothetical protein